MNVWTAVLRVRRDSMGNDPQDTVLRLRNTTVVLQSGNEIKRFRVDSAVFAAIPNRGRVRLSFGGRRGSVSIEIPRAVFWELSEVFYDRSATPDHPRPSAVDDYAPSYIAGRIRLDGVRLASCILQVSIDTFGS